VDIGEITVMRKKTGLILALFMVSILCLGAVRQVYDSLLVRSGSAPVNVGDMTRTSHLYYKSEVGTMSVLGTLDCYAPEASPETVEGQDGIYTMFVHNYQFAESALSIGSAYRLTVVLKNLKTSETPGVVYYILKIQGQNAAEFWQLIPEVGDADIHLEFTLNVLGWHDGQYNMRVEAVTKCQEYFYPLGSWVDQADAVIAGGVVTKSSFFDAASISETSLVELGLSGCVNAELKQWVLERIK
jgi:hypothetical protein